MLALIDGDLVSYRCAATAEHDEEWVSISRAVECIDNILLAVGADALELHFSDKRDNTFRRQLFPEYKANRTQPPPRPLKATQDYLITKYSGVVAVGEEADDALGIRQTMENAIGNPSIICSIDRDMLQIPGWHYKFVKMEDRFVYYTDGFRHFYKQLLIGDTADNIKGVWKIGVKKAGYMLDDIVDEDQMFDIVRAQYNDDERLELNGRLLWIRREPGEIWRLPCHKNDTLKQEVERMQLYSQPLQNSVDPTLEPTLQVESGFPALGIEQVDGTMSRDTLEN